MLIKRNAMGPQSGFTLIELIVVMMILAILVATAAPKFLNFQVDARKAAVDGLKAATESASQLVYGKSAIKGEESKGVGFIGSDITKDKVVTAYGYPRATELGIVAAITGVANRVTGTNFTSDWEMIDGPGSNQLTIKFPGSVTTDVGQCYLIYTEAVSSTTTASSEVKCVLPTT